MVTLPLIIMNGPAFMARPGPQTQAKRRRELAKKEKRKAKEEKKVLRKEQKKGDAASDASVTSGPEKN